jgi:hypothetical protein
MHLNFWDIDWGEDEAKGDRNLERYFVQIPEMSGLTSGKYHYIIGRKGTGKTAIIEKLRAAASRDAMSLDRYLSLKDFPLPVLRTLRDKNLRDKSQFVPIWSFLILVEVASMVAMDQGASPYELKAELADFLAKNFPSQISFTNTLSTLERTNHTVSIAPQWLGSQVSESTETGSISEIHFQKVISIIIDKLKNISSDATYFLFIDELDEGYKAGDGFLRLMLLALLRSVENLSLETRTTGLNLRPIVALRSDIFDSLEDNDINKLDDHIVRLSWTSESTTRYSLFDVVSARIAASADPTSNSSWESLIDEADRPGFLPRDESLFDFIVSRTYLRPRDLIKFLKCCQKAPRKDRLSFSTVLASEQAYSSWFQNEFRDEVQSFLPVWRQTLQCLSRVRSKAVFNFIWLRSELEQDPEIARWCRENKREVTNVINTLFDYSVIGSIDKTHRTSYRYMNPDASWRIDDVLTVHRGFRKQLRMLDPSSTDIDGAFQSVADIRARGQTRRGTQQPWWQKPKS